jgi:hypothetical protein
LLSERERRESKKRSRLKRCHERKIEKRKKEKILASFQKWQVSLPVPLPSIIILTPRVEVYRGVKSLV